LIPRHPRDTVWLMDPNRTMHQSVHPRTCRLHSTRSGFTNQNRAGYNHSLAAPALVFARAPDPLKKKAAQTSGQVSGPPRLHPTSTLIGSPSLVYCRRSSGSQQSARPRALTVEGEQAPSEAPSSSLSVEVLCPVPSLAPRPVPSVRPSVGPSASPAPPPVLSSVSPSGSPEQQSQLVAQFCLA
jgi:hypothetical protein